MIPEKEMIIYIKTKSSEQNNNLIAAEKADWQQVKTLAYSALENPAVTIVEGGSCACQGRMKRAVVALCSDISGGMQHISTLIQGYAYNSKINRMAFCVDGMNVIVEPDRIIIHKAKDEAAAMTVIEWLKDIIKQA